MSTNRSGNSRRKQLVFTDASYNNGKGPILSSSSREKSPNCCICCCNWIASCSLQMFNAYDLTIGSMLITFGIYIYFEVDEARKDENNKHHLDVNPTLDHLAIFLATLGGLFVLVALLSLCGIVSRSCRFTVITSGYLALVLAVISLAAGVAALLCEDNVLNFVDDNAGVLEVKPSQVMLIHNWYRLLVIIVLGSFVMETCRFLLSSYFTSTASLLDYEATFESSYKGEKYEAESKQRLLSSADGYQGNDMDEYDREAAIRGYGYGYGYGKGRAPPPPSNQRHGRGSDRDIESTPRGNYDDYYRRGGGRPPVYRDDGRL